MACRRLTMSREKFAAALQRASDSVASWPSIMAGGEEMSERLTDKELSDYAKCLDTSYEHGDIERRVVEELIERRAADREQETRQQTHSAVCWQWHPECAVARVDAFRREMDDMMQLARAFSTIDDRMSAVRVQTIGNCLDAFDTAMAGHYGKAQCDE